MFTPLGTFGVLMPGPRPYVLTAAAMALCSFSFVRINVREGGYFLDAFFYGAGFTLLCAAVLALVFVCACSYFFSCLRTIKLGPLFYQACRDRVLYAFLVVALFIVLCVIVLVLCSSSRGFNVFDFGDVQASIYHWAILVKWVNLVVLDSLTFLFLGLLPLG